MMMRKKANILITGTGGRSVGAGILHSLLRSSKDVTDRWNIVTADANQFAWGLYVNNESTLLPLARDPDYLDKLFDIINKYEINAVIPGTQPEVDFLTKCDKSMPNNAVLVCNKKELVPIMMDKSNLKNILKDLDLPFIQTVPLENWEYLVKETGFPLIIKPDGNSGASKDVFLIENEDKMRLVLKKINDYSLFSVQPFIGDSDNEYTVGVLSCKDGNVIDSIVMRRKLIGLSLMSSKKIGNISYDISTGYSQGFIVKHKIIQEFCEDLAMKLGSVGPLNIQLRLVDNIPYVFEIHPRFSGTTPIRADVGFNEVDVLLRNFLYNEKFSRLNYRYDVAAIRAMEHVIVPINQLKI
jgi:carbamoyl-phosphate synthase large subunit